MIKKILMFAAVIVATASCLNKSTFSTTGTMLANFEFNDYDYSKLFGSDSLYFDTSNKLGVVWDCLAFYHSVSEESEFQGGFIFSYLHTPKSGADGMLNNDYRVNCEAIPNIRNTYAVYVQNPDETKMPKQDFSFMITDYGTCEMQFCRVNNTVVVAEAVSQNFEVGDKLLLKAKGWNADKPTGEAEIVLAEKTSDKDSIICNWTNFDLTKLGDVDKVDFEIVAPEGKSIPTAVCIDDVVAKVSVSN